MTKEVNEKALHAIASLIEFELEDAETEFTCVYPMHDGDGELFLYVTFKDGTGTNIKAG